MEISDKGLALIIRFEGFRDKAYRDAGGTWTIGFGNTEYSDGRPVREGDTCTLAQAKESMRYDLRQFGMDVERLVKRDLKQNEFDALLSFRYNAGTSYKSGGRWRLYNIWKYATNGTITKEYWEHLAITSGGRVLKGLIKRRKAEAEMYFNE